MSFSPSSRWLLAAILVLSLVVRIGAAYWWQSRVPAGQRFGFPDSESYWELGQKIAAGKPYEFGPIPYRIFRTPGYPLLLSPIFLIGGQHAPVMAGRMLSVVLGAITVLLTAILARQLFDERIALLSALAVAIYPEAIAQSVFVLSEAPFTPLMVLQLIAWIAAAKAKARSDVAGWALAAGMAAGLATLMRPSWLLFLPFAGVLSLLLTTQRLKQLSIVGLMFVSFCLTMTPWWIYTTAIAGRFVPTSLQVGASLADGLNGRATGASDMEFVSVFIADQRRDDLRKKPDPRQLFEDRLDERMKEFAISWAINHPGRVLELAGIKFLRIWSPWPNALEFRSLSLRLLLMLSYTPAMILAGIGLWRSRKTGWPLLLLVAPAIYFTLLHMIFVSSIRYRQPAMIPLLIISAVAVAALLQFLRPPTKHLPSAI